MVDFNSLANSNNLSDSHPIIFVIIFIFGLVFAFYGANIMKVLAGLVGAILGFSFAVQLAYFFREQYPDNVQICVLIAGIIGAIIGAYLAIALMKALICGFFGIIGFLIGIAFFGNIIIAIIIGIALAFIVSMVINQFLAIITALLGGLMIGYLTLILFPTPWNFISFILLTIVIGALGAKYQLKSINR